MDLIEYILLAYAVLLGLMVIHHEYWIIKTKKFLRKEYIKENSMEEQGKNKVETPKVQYRYTGNIETDLTPVFFLISRNVDDYMIGIDGLYLSSSRVVITDEMVDEWVEEISVTTIKELSPNLRFVLSQYVNEESIEKFLIKEIYKLVLDKATKLNRRLQYS